MAGVELEIGTVHVHDEESLQRIETGDLWKRLPNRLNCSKTLQQRSHRFTGGGPGNSCATSYLPPLLVPCLVPCLEVFGQVEAP